MSETSNLETRPTTRKEQRAASIEKILDAALRLFVSQGYKSTTVEQIAGETGLTKGAVYFYFRSKEDIMLQLLAQAEEYVVDRMIDDIVAVGPDPRRQLIAFVHGQSRLALEHPLHMLLLILISLEFGGRGGDIETRTRAVYRRMYDKVEQVIGEGQAQGQVRSDLPSRELASVMMASHDGVFLEWYRRQSELDGKELTRALRYVLTESVLKSG